MASTRKMRSYSFPSVTAARYRRSTNTGANSFTSLTRTCTVALRPQEQKGHGSIRQLQAPSKMQSGIQMGTERRREPVCP